MADCFPVDRLVRFGDEVVMPLSRFVMLVFEEEHKKPWVGFVDGDGNESYRFLDDTSFQDAHQALLNALALRGGAQTDGCCEKGAAS